MKNLIKKFIPAFLIDWYHFLLAFLGAVLYRFPSKKMKVIGITGTKGKSTVVELTSRILEEKGYKLASLSSIKFKINQKEWPNILKMTMPGRFKLQKFLRQAVNSGCQYAVLEVTSEGIKQHRHRFIDFEVAVFTNLAPEHIEAHAGFENYRQTKGKLFQATKGVHIINLDYNPPTTSSHSSLRSEWAPDENAKYFLKFKAERKIGFTIHTTGPQITNQSLEIVRGENCEEKINGVKFKIKDVEFNLKLLGKFNISNALAAICVGLSQGVNLETCKRALEKIEGIAGRMEKVISEPFKVFVDYAHTPEALEKVYETLLKSKIKNQKSKMICVLGAAGGGRDKWKRPVLGEIAAKYCDEVIITNEDPYDENPEKILDEILSGFSKSKIKNQKSKVYKILDRREAIRRSLELAKPDDIVIITGKGCEPWICVARGKKIPWDDREVVREEFQKLLK